MQDAIDIEVQVISGRELSNPHISSLLKSHASYSVSLNLKGKEKRTKGGRESGNRLTWEEGFVFFAGVESTLKIHLYCMHDHRDDHIVGHANLDLLACDRTKDFEVTLHNRAKRSKQDVISGFLTLRVKVAFSTTFNVHESNAGLRSLAALHQMDNVIEVLSDKELQQLPSMWIQLVKALDVVASFADTVSQLDSRAKIAVGAVVLMVQILAQQIERDQKIDNLGLMMADLHTYVRDGIEMKKITTYERTLERLLEQTTECAYFIAEYRKIKHFTQRTVVNLVSNADQMIRQFETAFGELKIDLTLGSSLQTAVVSYRILQTVEKIENLLYINNLPYLKGAGWDTGRTCLHGTRQSDIEDIVRWVSSVDESSSKKIYILTGPVGCGKSPIAHTIAQAFSRQKRLAAAIFLKGHKDTNSRCLSSSLIYQLGHYNPVFMVKIADKLKTNVSLTFADIGQQFSELLVGSVTAGGSLDALALVGPSLIILDDLHEISDKHEQYLTLTSIAQYFALLPSNFRLLVTSRGSDLVSEVFSEFPNLCHTREITHENSKGDAPHEYMTWMLEQISSDALLERYTITDLLDQLGQRSFGIPAYTDIVYQFLATVRDSCGVNEMLQAVTGLLSMPIPLSREAAMDNLFNKISSYIPYSEYTIADLLLKYITIPQPTSPADLYALKSSKNIFLLDESAHESFVAILRRMGLLVCPTKRSGSNGHLLRLLPSYQDFLIKRAHILRETVFTHTRKILPKVCEDLETLTESMESLETTHSSGAVEMIVPYKAFITLIEEIAPDLPGFEKEFSMLFAKLEIFISHHIFHWMDYTTSAGHGPEVQSLLTRFYLWLNKRLEMESEVSPVRCCLIIEDLAKVISRTVQSEPWSWRQNKPDPASDRATTSTLLSSHLPIPVWVPMKTGENIKYALKLQYRSQEITVQSETHGTNWTTCGVLTKPFTTFSGALRICHIDVRILATTTRVTVPTLHDVTFYPAYLDLFIIHNLRSSRQKSGPGPGRTVTLSDLYAAIIGGTNDIKCSWTRWRLKDSIERPIYEHRKELSFLKKWAYHPGFLLNSYSADGERAGSTGVLEGLIDSFSPGDRLASILTYASDPTLHKEDFEVDLIFKV